MDCYVVLGVDRGANLSQIRRAHRALVHELDPDRAGGATARRFEHVEQAYESLSNPAARANHDRSLMSRERDEQPTARPGRRGAPRHLFDDFDHHRPSRDDVWRELSRNYTRRLPKSRPARPLNIEIVLGDDDAAAGDSIAFRIPAARACPTCAGTGRTGFFHCDACDGHGVTWSVAEVDVPVPSGAQAGVTVPASLAPLGIHTLFLNVAVRTSSGG